MGNIFNACCTMSNGDDDEIKISQLGRLDSTGNKKDPLIEYPMDETNDMSALNGSDTTKLSSSAHLAKKKIL